MGMTPEKKVPDKNELQRLLQSHEAALTGRSGTRIDLRFADFSHLFSENVRLDRARFTACNFSYANLSNSSFREADLSNSMFVGTRLTACDFTRANLAGGRFIKADLREAILTGAVMQIGALTVQTQEGMVAKQFLPCISQSHLGSAQLINASLRGVQLRDSNLTDANFQGADLRGADLSNSILTGADFQDARIDGAKLDGAVFDLEERSWGVFAGTRAFETYVSRIRETETVLRQHAEWVSTGGKRGARADFSGKSLRGLSLKGRELSAVSFVGADLTSTDLKKASLAAADFTGARLNFTDLRGADLRGAVFDGCRALFADMRITDCGPISLASGGKLQPRFAGSVFERSLFDGCNVRRDVIATAMLRDCSGLSPFIADA